MLFYKGISLVGWEIRERKILFFKYYYYEVNMINFRFFFTVKLIYILFLFGVLLIRFCGWVGWLVIFFYFYR